MINYQERTYRNCVHRNGLISFNVTVKETDLQIWAATALEKAAIRYVLTYRGYIEAYIQSHPSFLKALTPWRMPGPAPHIISDMVQAALKSGVGPMAAVAGSLAEHVGRSLLTESNEIIVENGGDIFLKIEQAATIGIFAGNSPLSMRLGIRCQADPQPFAVCTSSGTVGHSLSLGKADAVCTLCASCALADAAATAIGNLVHGPADIQNAIAFGKSIEGLTGIVVIIGDKIGLWGDLEIVPLK